MKRASSRGAYAAAIAIGAVLPDLSGTVFYSIYRFIFQMPENVIWQTVYPGSVWSHMSAATHSFPVVGVACVLAFAFRIRWAVLLCLSALLHALLDLPTHNFDAHAHFYPFLDFRFISPISYWDHNHYGLYFGIVELVGMILIFGYFWKTNLYRLWMGVVLAVYLAGLAYSFAVWS